MRTKHSSFLIVSIVAAACGGSQERSAAADPSKAAVVQAPPVILPADTAKPDTSQSLRDRSMSAQSQFSTGYALMTAGMILGDRQLLTSIMHSSIMFVTPVGKSTGVNAAVNSAIVLAQRMSLKDLTRQPGVIGFLADSVVTDSGTYTMTIQRPGMPAAAETGPYATSWRIAPLGEDWKILSDHLYVSKPDPAALKPFKAPASAKKVP
jgi:hypothetical protein